MNEIDVKHWLDTRERIQERVFDMVEDMRGQNITEHGPDIYWPGDDDFYGNDTVTVAWTEYGSWGAEWHESESFPLRWLWEDDWYKQWLNEEKQKEYLRKEKEHKEKEEQERMDKKRRRAQYHRLKKEFVNECPKCNGAGWVWWNELDYYDGPALTDSFDDTKYTCDMCKGTKEIEDEDGED